MKETNIQVPTLSSRNTVHVLRRLWHMSMMTLIAYLYWTFFTKEQALLLITTVGTVFLLGDCFRLKYDALNQAILKVLGRIMRKNELTSQSAMAPFILALFIVVMLFSKPIAIMAILYLGVGEPVASIVGLYYGKTKLFGTRKSFEGFAANFLVSTVLTYIILSSFHLGGHALPLISLIGGLGASLAEASPLVTDDNLHVPIISACILWLSLTFLY